VSRPDPFAIAADRWRARAHASDPVTWAKNRLGIDLYSQQRKVARSLKHHNRVAVRSAHDCGKTFVAAVIACWWIDSNPIGDAFVITTAPSNPQLKAVFWREMTNLHNLAKSRGNPLPGRLNQTEWWIGNQIVGMGRKPADWNTEAFQGIHAYKVLAIIDEAAGVPAPMWVGVEGVTSNEESRVLAIGNPDDPDGEFARVSETSNRVWHKIRISAYDTPAFTGEKVAPRVLKTLITPGWVEARGNDWGVESALFIARVTGEFPNLASVKTKVVPIVSVMQCMEPPDNPSKLARTPVELGMDVAAGGDETVLRERRGVFAGREWRERTPDSDAAVELAIQAVVESGATLVKVDEIGWGWGVIGHINSELRNKGIKCRAVPVNVATRSTQPTKFVDLRSELWWMARDLSKDGGWVLHGMDNANETVAQLTDPHWFTAPQGKIRVESKDETIKRLRRSPDDADALILAFANPSSIDGRATVARRRRGAVRSRAIRDTRRARRGVVARG
jgi:hypothetical protein